MMKAIATVATASKPGSTMWDRSAVGLDAEAMYRDHYSAVMRYVRARVASRELAEDLVSDIFCRAVAKAGAYQALRETALPWLYRIAANRVADHYRRQRPSCSLDVALEIADPALTPSEVVARQEATRTIWALSKGLPKSQHTALWLRYGEDLDLKEIAARMSRSVEAVKLLIHRALKRIRVLLEALASDPRPEPSSRARRPILRAASSV